MSWVDWLLAFVVFSVFGAIAWDMLMIVLGERVRVRGAAGGSYATTDRQRSAPLTHD